MLGTLNCNPICVAKKFVPAPVTVPPLPIATVPTIALGELKQ